MLVELSISELRQVQQLLTLSNTIVMLGTLTKDFESAALEAKINAVIGKPSEILYRQQVEKGIRKSYAGKPRSMKSMLAELDRELPLPPALQREVRP